MNLREGRIGRQESLALAAIALAVSGLFSSDPRGAFHNGNSAYIYVPLALMLAIAAFLLIHAAMKRSGAADLAELYSRALGPISPLFGLLLSIALCFAAAATFNYFSMLLHRYVFVNAGYPELLFYCVLPPLFMAWKGLECISRTAKFFVWILLISLIVEFAIAESGFETYRLFPIGGNGLESMLQSAGRGMGMFLPALSGLFICTQGLQGRKNARCYGLWAALAAGVVLTAAYFCIALSFSYHDATAIFSPLYRMSSLGQGNKYQMRVDKILLFLWLAGGMIAAAYYNYTAALQFARSFSQQDIRPAAGSFSLISAGVVLIHQTARQRVDIMAAATRYAAPILLLLLLFPAVIAILKKTDAIEEKA